MVIIMNEFKKITTEGTNDSTKDIDLLSTKEILLKINEQDSLVASAVHNAIDQIAVVVDAIVETFMNDGRLIYMGAGTSGRIGILDSVECPPTYGVPSNMVMCLMAGGDNAFVKAVEGAEDSKELAVQDLQRINVSANDIVVGIAASGRTPYVIGGIEYAKQQGIKTACITTSKGSDLASLVDYPIEAVTGQEVITGSTRMKSGTAQKLICNMLSTASMIKMGKVYSNYMIDVMATNEKLVARSHTIVSEITGCSLDEAKEKIQKYGTIKKALIAYFTGCEDLNIINQVLSEVKGNIRVAIDKINKGE